MLYKKVVIHENDIRKQFNSLYLSSENKYIVFIYTECNTVQILNENWILVYLNVLKKARPQGRIPRIPTTPLLPIWVKKYCTCQEQPNFNILKFILKQ